MSIGLETIAEFTWLWTNEFFLETSDGNYIWSDPSYGGDNTIRPYFDTFQEYLKECHISYGRTDIPHV